MTVIEVDNLRDGYTRIANYVYGAGAEVAPRGQPTREMLDALIILANPRDAIPVGTGRGVNPAIAAVEAAQLIGATCIPEVMVSVSKNFEAFMDDGRFYGAYGDRIKNQVRHVIRKLKEDPDTRQAVATLWDRKLDNAPGKHDYPCTTALFFNIRRGRLNLHVTMRSNDVWLGLAYDAFMFTQLQLTVAHCLRVEPGEYRHHAVSLHLYERDFDKLKQLHATDDTPLLPAAGFNVRGRKWDTALAHARYVMLGTFDEALAEPTESEMWYWNTLKRHTCAGA